MRRPIALRRIRRSLAIAALALVGGGFSAHAALIVIEQAQKKAVTAPAMPAGYETQDHFPGAALLYPPAAESAPAVGATGTTALPDLPLPAGTEAFATDSSVQPARPFLLAGASAEARARAQQCLTAAIYYEAGSESDDGQRGVAQVVLNRVRHPAFPNSVCGVIYQGSERATGCQFSYACDGSMARRPSASGWARAGRHAALALSGYVYAPVGLATHYHTYAVTPAWNRSLVMTAAIGAHFFQRWQGGWGTPAAFRQRYAAAEPFPGPKPRAVMQVATTSTAPAAAFPSSPFARPAFADSGRIKAGSPATPASGGLPETTMLDKWKGTGQALR